MSNKPTYSDPFASVDIQPVMVAGEEVPSKIAVRVKDDSGEYQVQGILGKDYQLLPNRKVKDIADDIMSRTGQQYGGYREIKTLWDGKRYVGYFASNNPIVNVKNGNDLSLHLGLMAWNAYDGTRKSGFEIYALNPFCTNQYLSRNRFGFFAWRHMPNELGKIDVDDAMQQIAIGAQNLIAVAPRFSELKKTPLTVEKLLEAQAKTEMPISRWGEVLARLAKEEPTLFGLFQALTFVASHNMSSLSAISIGSSITDYMIPMETKVPTEVMNHATAESVIRER